MLLQLREYKHKLATGAMAYMSSGGDDVSEEFVVDHSVIALLFQLKSKQRTQFTRRRLVTLVNLQQFHVNIIFNFCFTGRLLCYLMVRRQCR